MSVRMEPSVSIGSTRALRLLILMLTLVRGTAPRWSLSRTGLPGQLATRLGRFSTRSRYFCR